MGGHTDGMMVVRAHTRRGFMVLASDAAHFYENMTADRPFPFFHDLRGVRDDLLPALPIAILSNSSTLDRPVIRRALQELDERHMNTWSIAHGGVTMTLSDIALAMAARSLTDDGVGVVTVEMKVNFMQPGRGELRASLTPLSNNPHVANSTAPLLVNIYLHVQRVPTHPDALLFVQVFDEKQQKVAQRNAPPVDYYPMAKWQPGDFVIAMGDMPVESLPI